MSKLRMNATRMIASYTYGKQIRTLTPLEDMAVKYAQRTLLLEKACRYQKVAMKLAHCERYFDSRGDKRRRQRCTYKGSVYASKAAKLYKQAENV